MFLKVKFGMETLFYKNLNPSYCEKYTQIIVGGLVWIQNDLLARFPKTVLKYLGVKFLFILPLINGFDPSVCIFTQLIERTCHVSFEK